MDIRFQHPALGILFALCLLIYSLAFMAGGGLLIAFWFTQNKKLKKAGLRLLLVALVAAVACSICLLI
jgi:phosphoglycerol transferase MdoB-like AlkP superfamily enzyme